MKQAIIKMISRKSLLMLAGFPVFIVVVSVARNLFFPVMEPFGYGGIPKSKLVFGVPTFFVPHDFSGCIVYGPRFYPFALAVNIGIYSVLLAVVARLGLFRNQHVLHDP